VAGGQLHLAERRAKSRYPLDLSVRFRFFCAGTAFFGRGLAVNVSSGGILVTSKHRVLVGSLVEMSIDWPAPLDGTIPLQLVTTGRILRREDSQFAATFERYEFRTMRRPIFPDEEAPVIE
jgi:hypothetical protein